MLAYILMIVGLFHKQHQPRIETPQSHQEVFHNLQQAHYQVFNKKPNKNRLITAWAQIAIENQQGKKIFNNNFGNIGAPKHTNHQYFTIAGSRFIVSKTPLEGAKRYWKTLQNHCSMSLNYFDAGLPELAAYQLHRCRYYGADPDFYANAMKQLYWQGFKILSKLEE